MRRKSLSWLVVIVLLSTLVGTAGAADSAAGALGSSKSPTALVQVRIGGYEDLARFEGTGLPAFARLQDQQGSYLLAGASAAGQATLTAADLTIRVLDPDTAGATYYLGYLPGKRHAPDWSEYGRLLLDDGVQALLRAEPAQAEELLPLGVELRRVTLAAKPLRPTVADNVIPAVVDPDPMIQAMIDQITTEQVYQYLREFTGEVPVWVEGAWYTITSRATNSGTPIYKATHYLGERYAADGLELEYHVWNNSNNPNVIGQYTGLVSPDDIYLIGGHLDDVGIGEGADDNASGPIAGLIAADILTQFQWGCTLRFVGWTGEEQGLLGSAAYAARSDQLNENILGYLNLDMIAWNTIGSAPGIDLLYNTGMPPTLQLAQLFADVVDAYNLDLQPELETSLGGGSDHSSFWDHGYTSILAIEDQSDFNPYYHGSGDTVAHTDPAFFTNLVKASVATFAHMSGCLIPSGIGALDGHVTAASGGAPIEGATVTIEDTDGHTFSVLTDDSGYYTKTLLSDTYVVTASAYRYLPATVSGVVVTTDTLTTQDFALETAPYYPLSGHVTEAGSGLPLLAEIEIEGSPLTVWTDPADGSYSALLPPGSYTLQVRSAYHIPEERDIVISDSGQVQDFALDPTACNLVVDDDQGDNYQGYYQAALTAAGQEYDVWDVGTAGSPTASDLAQYGRVIWLTGDDYSSTLTDADQTALATYLDNGGRLFISGQDIGFDIRDEPFYGGYLHAVYVSDDTDIFTLTGLNYLAGVDVTIQGGDGANNQQYPSDITPVGGAVAIMDYTGQSQYGGVAFQNDTYRVVYLSFGFEAINNAPDRTDVMSKTLAWLGDCESSSGWLVGQVTDAVSGDPIEAAHVTLVPSPLTEIRGLTDPNGHYTFTLPAGLYDVTADKAGYDPQTVSGVVVDLNMTTTQDFALQPQECTPVDGAAFEWSPAEPEAGEVVSLSATADGSEPIAYEWAFGDGGTGSGAAVTHVYAAPGDYSVVVTATNACGQDAATQTVTVVPPCDPVADLTFGWEPLNPSAGQVITFSATAAGTEPLSYAWTFGDGATGSGPVVTHSYAGGGAYNVGVTAMNACGALSEEQTLLVGEIGRHLVYLPLIRK